MSKDAKGRMKRIKIFNLIWIRPANLLKDRSILPAYAVAFKLYAPIDACLSFIFNP